MVVTSPYGIAGPKGMDPGVVRVLHDMARAAQFDMPLEYCDTARRAEYEKAMAQRLNLRID